MKTQEDDMITKEEAAGVIGVSVRMVSRYVLEGYLTVYRNGKGGMDGKRAVRFSRRECTAMNDFEPAPYPGDTLVSRQDAALAAGVEARRIADYVREGRLTKYTDCRGRVRFSVEQCRALTEFRPAG